MALARLAWPMWLAMPRPLPAPLELDSDGQGAKEYESRRCDVSGRIDSQSASTNVISECVISKIT